MPKSPSQKKSNKIKQALSTNFVASWDDAWMDLDDLSDDQIGAICLTLTTTIRQLVSPDQPLQAMIVFLRWFFLALAPKLTMREAVGLLSPSMIMLSRLSTQYSQVAISCQEGLASLINRHPKQVGHLIDALRERFDIEYYDNGTIKDYKTPFHLFMKANASLQSVLLIALARVYKQENKNRTLITDLLWEKGFGCIPNIELFKFIQTAREHAYFSLSMLRRFLCSVDHAFPRSWRLRGQLRYLLDEINYALAKDYLPSLIDDLTKTRANFSMRLFSSKVSQVFH